MPQPLCVAIALESRPEVDVTESEDEVSHSCSLQVMAVKREIFECVFD